MHMPVKQLSVFFPAFNEEGNIAQTTEKALAVLKKLDLDNYEVIVVNDGSRDKTSEVAHELAKNNSHVKVVDQENGGYGMALRAGFSNAKYDWIVYTDADGQFDFSEINKFLEKAENNDYIIGYRMKRNDPFYRLIFAKIWALSVFFLFWIWVRDIDGGFKMINKRVLDKIPALKSTRGAMINAELLIKTKKYGFKIAQVGVYHYPRLAGKPTGASIKVIIQSYLELLKLWLKFH
jgi:glycosyltransferase involved in cell wall biosynthesis